MMSVSSVVEEPEFAEADEQLSYYAASERSSSIAESRRDSDLLIRETLETTVQQQLLIQSTECDDSRIKSNNSEE